MIGLLGWQTENATQLSGRIVLKWLEDLGLVEEGFPLETQRRSKSADLVTKFEYL